jgi:hypothetical protein
VRRAAGGRSSAAAVAALLALLLAIGLWNAARYPPGRGYDAGHHLAYADLLIHHGRLPGLPASGASEAETPPAYYAVAGAAWWVGERIGLGEPRRVSLALNVLMVLGTALLVLALARLLFPERRWLQVAALGYVALLPVVAKTGAMFHPENLDVLLSTLALYLATRLLVRRSFGVVPWLGVGVACGAALLTRKAGVFTFAAILGGLALVALLERRPRALRAAAAVLVVGAAMYAPWWVHAHHLKAPPGPQIHNVPPTLTASFFTGVSVPAALARPWRPHFANRVFPMTYTEIWGDYFGAFAWTPPSPPGPREQLRAQSALGIVPTVLAVAGWLLLLAAAAARRRELLPLALLPGIGLAGFLWYTAHDLAPDGDVIKATYILVTAPGWALGFAYALQRLPRRAALSVVALLVLSALIDLRFLVYGSPLGIF